MTATKMIELEREILELKMEIYHLGEKSRKSWMTNGGFAQEQSDWDKEQNALKERVIILSKKLI